MVNHWSFDQRPLRENVKLVPAERINPSDFDLAILHFDENVLIPHLCNGVIPPDWGHPFEWLLSLNGLPKVGVCHGTPPFEGQYGLDPNRKQTFVVYEQERRRLVEILRQANVNVVCNSRQALEEWQFANARLIWHGFDPQEFPRGTHDLGVLSLESDLGRPHYRGAWESDIVRAHIKAGSVVQTARHAGAPLEVRTTNAFATRNFRSYVNRIGRFSIYLNTTLRSPMPRSRGEAMLTGVIPVSLDNHDVRHFIQNGVNGFISDEPEELASYINYLLAHPEVRSRMSDAARATAVDVFNHDRYLSEWAQLIKEATAH
jgi:hypothetical protein